ncbi:MAG: PKD domain-containing protein, partial [Deltaproteobacteria bacterium]|nr:PKD domain-containing protein [Deltaproteobacteria bacterium]
MRRCVLGAVLFAALGCTSEDNLSPAADLQGPTQVRIGQAATFDASGSTDADGKIVSWLFDFGDGSEPRSAEGPVVAHVYEKKQSPTVTLTVTDDAGATGTVSRQVVVTDNLPPIAAFTAPAAARIGEPVLFDAAASSDPDGTIADYAWDFDGDGKSDASGVAVSHTYDKPGIQLAKLTVTDNDGATAESTHAIEATDNALPVAAISGSSVVRIDEIASFDGSGSTDPDGQIAKWEWDFDYDGKTFDADASGPAVNTTYAKAGSYTVALRVEDNDGGWTIGTHEIEVTPNVPPVAAIEGPSQVRIDEIAAFDGSGSADPDGKIAKSEWDFAYDGKAFAAGASGPAVNTTYAEAGSYTVALRVTDSDGDSTLVTHAITVTPNAVPVPAIEGPTHVRIDEIAAFDGSGSTDPDGLIVKHEWDFDYDGKLFGADAAGPAVSNGWPLAGQHTVALRVTDSDGAQAVTTHVLEVTANEPPHAALSGPTKVRIDEVASFDGSGSRRQDRQARVGLRLRRQALRRRRLRADGQHDLSQGRLLHRGPARDRQRRRRGSQYRRHRGHAQRDAERQDGRPGEGAHQHRGELRRHGVERRRRQDRQERVELHLRRQALRRRRDRPHGHHELPQGRLLHRGPARDRQRRCQRSHDARAPGHA